MSAMPAGPGRSTETPRDTSTAEPARHGRFRAAAAARGVPLTTILVTVAVVALTYLAGKLAYRIRDVLLMLMVAGFIALILNPLVVALQRWRIRRRGWAVAIVSIWAVLVFAGLLAAFGYPLAHGLSHFSQRLPSYVQNAEHGRGGIGHLIHRFHLELLSILVGTSIGDWIGGFFGSFVAALLSIPVAGALQVITRELWQATAWPGPPDSEPPAEPGPAGHDERALETDRRLLDGEQELTQ